MKKSEKLAMIGLLAVILFVIILLNLNSAFITSIDDSSAHFFTLIDSNFLIQASKFASYIFEPDYVVIYMLVISLLLFIRKKKTEAGFFALSGIFGGGLIYIVKEIVQRARPIDMLVSESSFSFPSGHAAMAVIFFGYLAFLTIKSVKNKNLKTIKILICILLTLIIGLSRLILQVHFLSDVLAGFLLGIFVLFSVLALRILKNRFF